MIYIFLAAVFALFSFQFFTLNFAIQGLNRAIVYTPIELMMMDVSSNGNKASFTTSEIEEHLVEYYDKTLLRYVKEYDIDFYFYNREDESICTSNYCDGVEIRIDTTIMLSYKYHRVMYYELVN